MAAGVLVAMRVGAVQRFALAVSIVACYMRRSGGQWITERRIRQDLGDSPDTSKALRHLVKERMLIRKGKGGRIDPFMYRSCQEWEYI